MNRLISQVRVLWNRYNRSPRRHVLEAGVIGLSFVFMIRLLIASLTQISQTDIRFNGLPILFAASLTFLSAVCGTLGWAHIIRALHPNIAYLEAIRYHLLSVTTKYFPGFGWQQVSKVVQLTRNGVSLKSAALPVTLELSLVLISGAMIGSLCFVTMPVQRVFFSTQAITALGILVLIIFFLTPFLIAKWAVRREANRVPSENYVRISIHLLIAQILLAVSWICLGVGLWFTSRIFYETSSSDVTYFILSTVLGFLVSLAVVFVPNGWGVREVTLALLLQPVFPSAIAVACSIMFRLIVVLVEIACVVPVPVLIYRKMRT